MCLRWHINIIEVIFDWLNVQNSVIRIRHNPVQIIIYTSIDEIIHVQFTRIMFVNWTNLHGETSTLYHQRRCFTMIFSWHDPYNTCKNSSKRVSTHTYLWHVKIWFNYSTTNTQTSIRNGHTLILRKVILTRGCRFFLDDTFCINGMLYMFWPFMEIVCSTGIFALWLFTIPNNCTLFRDGIHSSEYFSYLGKTSKIVSYTKIVSFTDITYQICSFTDLEICIGKGAAHIKFSQHCYVLHYGRLVLPRPEKIQTIQKSKRSWIEL